MAISQSNFEKLKIGFKKETGLNSADNMGLYISYYHAKAATSQAEILYAILEELKKQKK